MPDLRARAVARLPHLINGKLDLDEVLRRVLDQIHHLLASERSAVLLLRNNGTIYCHAAHGMTCADWETKRFSFSRQLVERVFREQRACLTSDAQVDQRPDLARSMGIQSILCAPFTSNNRSIGVIYVERRLTQGIFTADDLDLLEKIALHCGVAIENARRYGHALEQGRRQGETGMAESLVLSLLPQEAPMVPGYDVAARWESAGDISADFYDIFPVNERERWGLVVADVSDRGPPAAIFMALTRSIIRGSVASGTGPRAGILQANRLIHADAQPDRYVTTFYGELDARGELRYVNAGFLSPLWWHAESETVSTLEADRQPLGRTLDLVLEERAVQMGINDVLLFFSDGLVELTNAEGNAFGKQRLGTLLAENATQPTSLIAAAIQEELHLWLHGRAPHDDLLLVLVKYEEDEAG